MVLGKRVLISILVALVGPTLGACSSDAPEPPPHGPKDLAIGVSPIAEAMAEVRTTISAGDLPVDNCSVGLSADDPIPLLLWVTPYQQETNSVLRRLDDFELQPPGQGCSAGTNCGWMLITASAERALCSSEDDESCTQTILAIRSPWLLELPSTTQNTILTLGVELRDSTGAPVLAEDGKPLHADAVVNVVPTACVATP